jgi:hypothetical protein
LCAYGISDVFEQSRFVSLERLQTLSGESQSMSVIFLDIGLQTASVLVDKDVQAHWNLLPIQDVLADASVRLEATRGAGNR